MAHIAFQHNAQEVVLAQGTVYRKNKEAYEVHSGEQIITCLLSARLRKELAGLCFTSDSRGRTRRQENDFNALAHVDPIAVGDRVRYQPTGPDAGVILERLPRQNKLSRPTAVPMPGAHSFEQVIVANMDQVIPVFAAAAPRPSWNMLDRYLVAAEGHGLPAVVCITKLDLAQDDQGETEEELMDTVDEYRRIGYRVVLVSALSGEGLEEMRDILHGRVTVLLGKSGVGKTSLLNALQPGLGLRVNAISQMTGKGKHTTTHLEMFPLDFGGAIVDTPGVREFGLWDIDQDDLASLYPEMRPYLGQCRFGLDCTHDEEPGCAIRKAVTAGQISPRRYQSYMRLKEDT